MVPIVSIDYTPFLLGLNVCRWSPPDRPSLYKDTDLLLIYCLTTLTIYDYNELWHLVPPKYYRNSYVKEGHVGILGRQSL